MSSIGFDEKDLTGEMSKGNFNGSVVLEHTIVVSVVLEHIIVGSEEGQVVVNAGNFQKIGPC